MESDRRIRAKDNGRQTHAHRFVSRGVSMLTADDANPSTVALRVGLAPFAKEVLAVRA